MSGSSDAGRSAELAKHADEDPYFMSNRYLEYVAANESIAQVFRVILEQKENPIVLHCSAGKDRTGVITYLLLSLHMFFRLRLLLIIKYPIHISSMIHAFYALKTI